MRTIRKCSTQSYLDGFKIMFNNRSEVTTSPALSRAAAAAHTRQRLPPQVGYFPVERGGGDGQLVLLYSYLKKRFPERYKNLLIDGGDFHAFAHMMFANHERFFDVCGSAFCDEVRAPNSPRPARCHAAAWSCCVSARLPAA